MVQHRIIGWAVATALTSGVAACSDAGMGSGSNGGRSGAAGVGSAGAAGAGSAASWHAGGAAGASGGGSSAGEAGAGQAGAGQVGAGQAGAGQAGAGGGDDAGTCARFVTGVVAHAFGPGQNTGQDHFPNNLYGPPHGGGCCKGDADPAQILSLGDGGSVTVQFGDTTIVDAPGPDFIVFENAFYVNGDPTSVFAELATVEVSDDGTTWTAFPCTATAPPYGTCAGWHPVYANPDENSIEPLDPATAGGDAFDLADIGVASARYVRITDRADIGGMAGVFDLDAVGVVHASCP